MGTVNDQTMTDPVYGLPKSASLECSAALFDLDGTIADTERAHGIAYKLAFAKVGVQVSEGAFAEVAGRHHLEVIQVLSGGAASIDPAMLHQSKSLYFSDIAKHYVRPLPLLRMAWSLKGRVPVALVTSASFHTATVILGVIGAQDLFDVVISGDHVRTHKPDPEPYLEACRILGSVPESCLAFEDSVAGCESAARAGINVVRVGKPIS